MHMILCHGPIDFVQRITVDKRIAWEGAIEGGPVTIAAEGLFGGEEREGGVSGQVDVEMGYSDQTANTYLQSQLGADMPSFRKVVGMVLRRCYLGLNPYLKAWGFRAQRIHVRQDGIEQWYDEKAAVGSADVTSIPFNETFGDLLASYTLLSGNLAAFSTSGPILQMRGDLGSGQNKIERVLPVPAGAQFRQLKFLLRVNELGTGDTGIVQIFDADETYIHGFNAGWNGVAYKPLIGYNSNEGPTASIGPGPLPEGRWYQYTAVYDPVAGNLTCSLVDVETGVTWGSTTVSGPSLPAAYIRFWTASGGGKSADISEVVVEYVVAGGQDMNPAHIIRECLTDPDWGMGYSEADIDDDSFEYAADMLHSESMGISILWDRQTPIEDFINEIVKHISASVYVDRTTGKFVLKLIRADYDFEDLLVLDQSNITKVDSATRPTAGELVNSVTAVFWNQKTGENGSVTVQDQALIQMQGAVINTTLQYPGFTNQVLASKAALRALTSLSIPLLSCTVYADRKAASLNIGDVFRMTWPDLQVDDLVMRVTGMALGDGRSNVVKLTVIEDVFAFPETATVVVPENPGTDGPDPTSPAMPAQLWDALEMPYYEAAQQFGQAQVDSTLSAGPDTGFVMAGCARPAAELTAVMQSDSGVGFEDVSSFDFCPGARLLAAAGPVDTVLSVEDMTDMDLVTIGAWGVLGGTEIVRVDAVDEGAGTVTVGRGALDTLPSAHAAGAVLVFLDYDSGVDPTEYVSGEEVSVRVLPVSGAGTLDPVYAVAEEVTLAGRAIRPYPPGNLQVNGEYFPDFIGGTAELALTWAHRDRAQQTAGDIADFFDGNIGPEVGQTYTLRIYNETDVLLRTEAGLTSTGYTYDDDDEILDGGGTAGDAFYANVSALLHFDGADASTVAVDETGKTWTTTNQAQIDTAQSKFGGACALFDGATDRFTSPASADFTFGTGSSTVEFWMRPANVSSGYRSIVSDNVYGAAGGWRIYQNGASIEIWTNGADQLHNATSALAANTWVHVAWVRNGTNSRLFLNGVLHSTYSTTYRNLTGTVVHVGYAETYSYNGHIDELRITKGVARYSANFTVETGAFPGPVIGRLNGRLRFELESLRGGHTSLQKYDHVVRRLGYGMNYGINYGE
jgi:hypothetical protein